MTTGSNLLHHGGDPSPGLWKNIREASSNAQAALAAEDRLLRMASLDMAGNCR